MLSTSIHASQFAFKAANCGETAFNRLPQHFRFIKSAGHRCSGNSPIEIEPRRGTCSTLRADERRIKSLICHRRTLRTWNCCANGGISRDAK
jgi:hypothetical protein